MRGVLVLEELLDQSLVVSTISDELPAVSACHDDSGTDAADHQLSS